MAAARAAARRQAILNSRSDRLAKLTSSARGDDPGGVFAHDDPPLPTLGSDPKISSEESLPRSQPIDTPKAPAKPAENIRAPTPEWDSVQRQQEELLRKFMGEASSHLPSTQVPPSLTADSSQDHSAPEDLLSKLLSSLGSGSENKFTTPDVAPPRPRTLMQKLIPVVHLLSMLMLLAWFVAWKEPQTFAASWQSPTVKSGEGEQDVFLKYSGWRRWANLAKDPPTIAQFAVPPMPTFFWAFTTLELVLHSLRIFSQADDYRPPMLIGLVLPYLPPQFSQSVLTSLKYFQMVGMVLDDLAILLFGIGLVVFVSNWAT